MTKKAKATAVPPAVTTAAAEGAAAANAPQNDTLPASSQALKTELANAATAPQRFATSGPPTIQIGGLMIKAAKPKVAKGEGTKSTRPFCSHEYGHGPGNPKTRCQLRVVEGFDKCVNHLPAENRLTAKELTEFSNWLEGLKPEERLVGFVRAIGWSKAKSILGTAGPGTGAADGDKVVGELFGIGTEGDGDEPEGEAETQ